MSDQRAAFKVIIRKLAKLIPLFASDKPGEVLNTAQAIARLLASVNLDFHDLVTFVTEEPAPPGDLLRSPIEKDRDALLRLGLARASFFHSDAGARSRMSSSTDIAQPGRYRASSMIFCCMSFSLRKGGLPRRRRCKVPFAR